VAALNKPSGGEAGPERGLKRARLHVLPLTVWTIIRDERQRNEGDGGFQPGGPIILTARALETVVSSSLSFGISPDLAYQLTVPPVG